TRAAKQTGQRRSAEPTPSASEEDIPRPPAVIPVTMSRVVEPNRRERQRHRTRDPGRRNLRPHPLHGISQHQFRSTIEPDEYRQAAGAARPTQSEPILMSAIEGKADIARTCCDLRL